MHATTGASRQRCGVLGSPIAHSLSPVLHLAAYDALGLDWEYTAHEVTEAELAGFIAGLDETWRGLSLTMPLKREVIGLCDAVEPRAALLESVNTVVIGADGTRTGSNTDVAGMVAAFRAAGVDRLRTVGLIGGGATAASALAAVADLGAEQVVVLVRSPERARGLVELAGPLGLSVEVAHLDVGLPASGVDAVVSTIPADAQRELAAHVASAAAVIFDVLYHPRDTPFLMAAAERGQVGIGGFELLLHQAGHQVELMTGTKSAPLDVMRAAGLGALAER